MFKTYSTIFLYVIVTSCVQGDDEWMKCKATPGCSITQCSPTPSWWFRNDGESDGYHILCQKRDASASESSDGNSKYEKISKELMTFEERLGKAEIEGDELKLVMKNLEKEDTELKNQIEEERQEDRKMLRKALENFEKLKKDLLDWKSSVNSELEEVKSVIANKTEDLKMLRDEVLQLKSSLHPESKRMEDEVVSALNEMVSPLEPLPAGCGESGTSHGVSIIRQDEKTYEVYCDMSTDGGNWTVFQRRMDGSVDFNRTWEEYAIGFGNLSGEFWLGLETVHQLTKDGTYELRIDLTDWDGTKKYVKYETFVISARCDGYRLIAERFSGTAGDSLYRSIGRQFSAKDKDLDNLDKINCAAHYHTAWWFNRCGYSSLNGIYNDTSDWRTGVHWSRWGNKGPKGRRKYFSLKASEMKFRKK